MVSRLDHEATAAEERALPVGDLRALVRVFEAAVVVHLPTGTRRGNVQ